MSHTAGELAEYLRAKIHGDGHAQVAGFASPECARPEDLIYVDSPRQVPRAEASAARCAIVAAGVILAGKTVLEVENPKLAFAKAAAWLLPMPALGVTVPFRTVLPLVPLVPAGP